MCRMTDEHIRYRSSIAVPGRYVVVEFSGRQRFMYAGPGHSVPDMYKPLYAITVRARQPKRGEIWR